MGRLLISSMMACTSLAMDGSMRERLGGWRWITSLRFSLPPRWYELYGSAKYAAMPDCSRSRPWRRACRSARQSAACPIVVVLVDVLVDQREHLPTGVLLPPLGVDGLDLHPAEDVFLQVGVHSMGTIFQQHEVVTFSWTSWPGGDPPPYGEVQQGAA